MTDRIIDAHMHLWDLSNEWYPGLHQMAEGLGRPDLLEDFGIDRYRAEAGPDFEVSGFVHVSATTAPRAYLQETAWVDRVADEAGLDLVVVATVDPTLDRDGIVADLEEQAASERFRGARVLYDFEPDGAAADTVLRWLDERGLVFDLVCSPASIPGWLETLARFPDLQVVLEHTGWPSGTDEAAREEWAEAITRFADATGALCKLSGLGMTTLDLGVDTLRPWLDHAIGAFGWDRIAFASNMPIEKMAGSYRELIDAIRAVTADASEAERAAFFAGNAARVYRL